MCQSLTQLSQSFLVRCPFSVVPSQGSEENRGRSIYHTSGNLATLPHALFWNLYGNTRIDLFVTVVNFSTFVSLPASWLINPKVLSDSMRKETNHGTLMYSELASSVVKPATLLDQCTSSYVPNSQSISQPIASFHILSKSTKLASSLVAIYDA